ncbi:MAG: SH3 domain-containing protein [Hyphomicrobiales bacterium]
MGDTEGVGNTGYVGFLPVGNNDFRAIYRWSVSAGITGVTVADWISPTLAIGRVNYPQDPRDNSLFAGLPSLIDFERGTVAPIAEFLPELAAKAGGPVPVAVELGTFLRVSGAGDCLNVRAEPGTDAAVLGCYADRVLLGDRGESREAGGIAWRAVTTPDGREGWASSEFLAP